MLRTYNRALFGGRHNPLPYQAEAVQVTKNLEHAALFHEQGLGKTKMALDLILYWLVSGTVDSALVITKKTLVENWEREIKFHTHLRSVVIGQNRRANFYAFNRPGRLYLSHYEAIYSERGRFKLFAKSRRLGVILDESQRIKNPKSRPAIALHSLAPYFVRRIIMTGTPVANRPYDLWSQIYFLDMGASLGNCFQAFKSDMDFTNEFQPNSEITNTFENRLLSVYRKINQFTIRETKQSAEIILPQKNIRNISAQLESTQHALYEKYRTELAAEVLKNGVSTLDEVETILKRLLRLVQVASNPKLVDEDYISTPGKLNSLDEILKKRDATKQKTIIWTGFTGNVDMIARRYTTMNPARMHGKRTIADRNKDVRRFIEDPCCRILVATPGAAKEGLTLTVANHAIFFDRTFSLDDYLQAQDRIHRISQENLCLVENIVASGTIDEWIAELLSAKQLAASLTLGDINIEEYREQATYAFNQALREAITPRRNNDE